MALPKAFATMGLLLGGSILVVAYLLSSFSLQELVHVSQVALVPGPLVGLFRALCALLALQVLSLWVKNER